jgi:hypothetical protein
LTLFATASDEQCSTPALPRCLLPTFLASLPLIYNHCLPSILSCILMKLLPNWKVLSPQIDNQPTPLEPGAQEPRAQLSSLIYSYQSQKEKLEAALASCKDTLTLCFPALGSLDPSCPSTLRLPPPEAIEPSRGRERSESPNIPHQCHCIDEPAWLEPTNEGAAPSPGSLSPMTKECKMLSLKVGTHALFPKTWTQQCGDKGSLVHLAKTG